MNILVSAFACEPNKGSEPGVGWGWVSRISKEHDVWVLTLEAHREGVEAELRRNPNPRLHFEYVDLPPLLSATVGRVARVRYYLWQLAAWRVAKRLHQRIGFDCGHHVSYGTYWMPSFLPFMPFPYIWGPVGGGEGMPLSFFWDLGPRGKVFEAARFLAQRAFEFDPWVRMTARRAALSLASTEQTEARICSMGGKDVRICSHTYISAEELYSLASLPIRREKPFRAASAAILIHWKGFEIAIRAFARLAKFHPDSEYWIFGEGPDRERFERLAAELGVARQVKFWGFVHRSEWVEKLRQVDVLLFPSLHDSGGFVCLEALAAGRPVACLDIGGPGFQVTDDAGVRVPAIRPQQAVDALGDGLVRLVENPELRYRLAAGARRRALTDLNFDEHADWIADMYPAAVRRRGREAFRSEPVAAERS